MELLLTAALGGSVLSEETPACPLGMLAGPTETLGTNEGSQGALGALSIVLPALEPSVQTKPMLLSINSP